MLVFFPRLLCISILSLSRSCLGPFISFYLLFYIYYFIYLLLYFLFYIIILLYFFPFHVSLLWNPWLSLSTVQKITPDCWQAASTWPVHCCQGQAVNVLLHVSCCFLYNSCCSSGVCVFSVWLKFCVCVHAQIRAARLCSIEQSTP